MMSIKYFIFLCIIFYTPAVNSGYTPEQMKNLWDKIRTTNNQYITLADLKKYYGDKTYEEWYNTESFKQVLALGNGGVWKLDFECFIYSLDKDWFINMEISGDTNTPLVTVKDELMDLWNDIRTPVNEYITLADLKKHYGAKTYEAWYKTESFRQVFALGDSKDGVWKLNFEGFIYSLEKGWFINWLYGNMEISGDKNTSLVTIKDKIAVLWDKIRTHDNQYITLADLKKHYGDKTYEEWYKKESFMEVLNLGDSSGGEWKLNFDKFKKFVYLF